MDYKEVLEALLKGAAGRDMFSGDEVRDMLLDLWSAVDIKDVIEPEVALAR